ncbi:MAG: VOC family protein [Gammaproteobacteria bacterium]|nr:VOC family protein [Gammaproteobacteria bacterium]MDE0716065.1 VOC family protein [Gammaproteobacteria bacterium]MYH90490.1 glyoxalase/bleomycin resistance/dioxygenase family protein [Gammaproteobacteria bacterium]
MKLHLSLSVNDFDASVAFYSRLFRLEPKVLKDGYAKWDVEEPPVNFAIEQGAGTQGVDHLGIQADSDEELDELASRVRESGQPFLDVERLDCCHARMDKAWVKGMADEKWEVFLTHRHDLEEYGETQGEALAAL